MKDLRTVSCSFGELLKTARKRRHRTQKQLAQQLDVHANTVSSWELGTYLPATRGLVLELAKHLHLDDQETRSLLEASLTALSPHWLVPLPRNLFFTGREEILELLHTQLGTHQAVALTQSSALHGLGGVGKTQVALEYAYQHALEYSAVFWVGAETEEQIISSLLRIAEALHLPGRDDKDQQRVVATVQGWLTTHSQWLLIWDNVEDLALLDHFLPPIRQGAILITTRCQAVGTHARGIDLLPMKHEEGMLFVLRRAKTLESDGIWEHVQRLAVQIPLQYAAAAELVEVVGGLPLALDQAGAYIEETECGLPAYLDLFRARRAALLQQRGEGSRDHPASVSTTFTLAITATAGRHPAVWDLLQVCALIQPDAIPEELFRQGAEHLGATLKAVCGDTLAWDGIVAVACSYSLLSRQPEEQTLSMHRLVQAVLLDTMTDTEREQWSTRVIKVLNAAFPEIRTMTNYVAWKQGERLLPHTLLCLHRIEEASEPLTLASLAYKAALYLRERGRYVEAEPLYLHALHILEQQLGSEHPRVATALNNLALLYWNQGKYSEAEPLYLRALHILEQSRGPEHLEVARPLHNLAVLYYQQGKYAEAEPLYLRALHIKEQQLGSEHLEVTLQLTGLAELYRQQSKYTDAEPLYLRALRVLEQQLESEHPQVAHALSNLAELYRQQGKYTEAEPLYLRALHILEQSLGSEHPDVAQTLNGLANLFREQSKYAEAEPLFQRALSICESHLGQHHPDTAEPLYNLALLRKTQGNLSEAISLTNRALSIRSQSLGDTHPKTIATRTLVAQLLQEQAGAQRETSPALHSEEVPDLHREELQMPRVSLPLQEAGDLSSPENHPLQGFLDACCELHPRACCRISDLWQMYERWAAEHQERFPLSRRAFAAQLKGYGCRTDRTNTVRIWRGITLVKQER